MRFRQFPLRGLEALCYSGYGYALDSSYHNASAFVHEHEHFRRATRLKCLLTILDSRNTAIGVEVYMVNTKRGRFTSTFWRSLGVFLLSVPLGTNAVEISNGVPAGTVGSFRVDLETAGGTRIVFVTAAPFASNDIVTAQVIRNYYAFVDVGNDGVGDALRFLSASNPVPDPINPNIVTSNGSFFNNANRILWTAVSSIAPGAQVMTNTYTFTAETGALGPLRFLQHLDRNGALNDVFSPTGSAVGGDLKLSTFDNTDVIGLSHSGIQLPGTGLQNASFAGWAADQFDNIITSIFTARPQVSPAGIINLSSFQHPQLGPVFGPADIVSVLAWDVDPNATSAAITTSLRAIAISVEAQPVGNLLVGNQLRCQGNRCTLRARCMSPEARCTNQFNVTVTKKALGSRGGPPTVAFGSGTANVAPGQNGTLQLRLTKRGRNFVRSTTKKRIVGRLEIKSIDRVAVNAFRCGIRIIQ